MAIAKGESTSCKSAASQFSIAPDLWLDVREAPEPSVIIWNNLSVGGCNRFIRTLLVAVGTIVLLAVSVTGIVVTKYYQDLYSSEYNLSNCGSITVTKTEAFADYNLPPDRQLGLMNCYCYDQLKVIQ